MATGRIVKHGDTYRYIISVGRDPVTGKYKQIWRSGFKTKREADEKMRDHLHQLADGQVPVDQTLSQFLKKFVDDHCKGMKPSALWTYDYTCQHYIVPILGKVKLDKLSHSHIQQLYEAWNAKLAPSTVHRIHRVLRTALNYAVKQGYLVKSPMTRVDAPERRTPRRTILSVQQAKTMLTWLKQRRPGPYKACFLAIYTGMRCGEVAGLQWGDVEWDTNVLHVRRSRQRTKGEDIVGTPKTADSERDIVVPDMVMNELRLWYDAQRAFHRLVEMPWDESLYVVRLPDGEVPDPHIFARGVKVALTKLGLPIVTFHDLRHTHASWLLESGVDLKVVSQRLGHSSISVTADVYSHVTRRLQEDAVKKLENMMGGETSH
ncbi:site-specific integrase [Alicyclobacillus fastidiosus]|uniref:Site-specific integrase n=1 Tax=Alicyclobacillus fastidiosus TaxID=392011 RepID=A0ABV5AL43_9BACL|nr:site-specific integrase [Alicyclobacillus fastidiosus]WEH08216.1 site-specific integrase [Alicyclobacillus fastidiosus]